MERVQIYLIEAKRIYLAKCLEGKEELDAEVIKRFDELIRSEVNDRKS